MLDALQLNATRLVAVGIALAPVFAESASAGVINIVPRRAHELANIFVSKETVDSTSDEVLGRVGHRVFLAFSRGGRGSFFSDFRFGHSPCGGQLNLSLPGVYGGNAEEPWPHSVQRSPRLAAHASRSWSQAGASLQ
jgi:hypothetical protein